MSTEPEAKTVDRRGFLKALGAGAGATGLAAAAAIVVPATAEAAESAADKKKKRYKETAHVQAYYRTNRY
jgi:anaerobic selenocysteine-containing dehydrogenase